MKLKEAVDDALYRLDDTVSEVWTRAEMELYIKDGYDKFCRQTKAIFDIAVIENVPSAGNWSTDLERWHAEHTPGMGITDRKMHFTGEHERNLTTKSLEGPTSATSPSDITLYNANHTDLPSTVPTGKLPDGTVEVIRVAWNNITLTAMGSQTLRRMDPRYETLQGDPRFWTWDKDGLLTIRLVPVPNGDAAYDTIDGSRGSMKQTDETTTVVGTRGILREREGVFPAFGPRGTPRRQHPDEDNTKVEISRLGRDPQAFDFEIPRNYVKYPIFWAMSQALRRDGPGQDRKLAEHYSNRFELGINRMVSRMRDYTKERLGSIGHGAPGQPSFALGMPQLPWEYGPNFGRPTGGGY